MDKAGWQVTAAICASLSVMLGAVAYNTKRSLEVANAQLAARAAKPPADPFTATPVDGLVPPEAAKWLDGTDCRGGVLLRKTPAGWDSLTDKNGNAITCENVHRFPDGREVRWK